MIRRENNFVDYEVIIDRVIITGPPMDGSKAQHLRELIVEELQEKMESLKQPDPAMGADVVRVELPDFPSNAVEWERRLARAAADAVFDSLRGKKS